MYGDDPRDLPRHPRIHDEEFASRAARAEEEESLETDRDWLTHLTGVLGED